MKSINKIQNISKNDERFERKILLRVGQSSLIRNYILEKGFKKNYKKRKITSIYFDDINLNCLRDNVNGNRERYKIRLRWYDDNFENSNLEIKFKDGFLGYKIRYPLFDEKKNLNNLIYKTNKWVKNNFGLYMRPSLKVSYLREYYTYKNLRLTIDNKMNAFKIIGASYSTTNLLNNEVIEIKYNRKNDNHFREIYKYFQKINLRVGKSSKYSLAMMS